MCNAWNHSPDCACGFGGDDHLGISGRKDVPPEVPEWIRDGTTLSGLRIDIGRFESYVNPNAICPVCGQEVFFYQSPDGGRVYFDDLGPPWPKHPCTDNGKIPKENKGGKRLKPRWLNDGWLPFRVFNSTSDSHQLIVKGYLSDGDKIRFVTGRLVNSDPDFESSNFKFLRRIDEERLEILFMSLKNDRVGKIEVYASRH